MKKSELRKIIKEEIQQGDYPELHKIITDKDQPPFMTEEDWKAKWSKKLNLPVLKEWHQDDVAGLAFALVLMLDFNPDIKYISEVRKLAKADSAWNKGNTLILEWHDPKGASKAVKFARDNYLI